MGLEMIMRGDPLLGHLSVQRILILVFVLGAYAASLFAEQTTTNVAIVMASSEKESPRENTLIASVFALLEQQVLEIDSVRVVERMQLRLALEELAIGNLSATVEKGQQPQLGKLLAADLILGIRLINPTIEKGKPAKTPSTPKYLAQVRIAESKTGTIRGATVIPVTEFTVEAAAVDIGRYFHAVLKQPALASTSVAVEPFESVGQFDRLRPMELGIRDLVTARLLKYSGYQVLQRFEMQQLLTELDLMRSGFVDRDRLPTTLPSREAAYFVRGTVDERETDRDRLLIVKGQLVHAVSGKSVLEIDSRIPIADAPRSLAMHADRIAMYLTKSATGQELDLAKTENNSHETDELLQQVMRDMHRFFRRNPRDFGIRPFRIPGSKYRYRPVPLKMPLGRHLLTKSIDRLESLQYLQPDRLDVRFALAYCLSYHFDGVWQPDRVDKLLRDVHQAEPTGMLAKPALDLLAEHYFHHEMGRIDSSNKTRALKSIQFAFLNMPPKHRDDAWSRMVGLLLKTAGKSDMDMQILSETLEKSRAWADGNHDQNIGKLPVGLASIANRIAKDSKLPHQRSTAQESLLKWADSSDHNLRYSACWSLAGSSTDPLVAAKWYLHAAEVYNDGSNPLRHDNLRMHAARRFIAGNKIKEALALLQSYAPAHPSSLNYGYHAVEMGRCYEMLGEDTKALEIYVNAAEQSRGLTDNSQVEKHIKRLGGVPLREDRDIQVEKVTAPGMIGKLATDGSRIFAGYWSGNGIPNITVFDIATGASRKLDQGPRKPVSCLQVVDNVLWVGTTGDGLWRYEIANAAWKRWSEKLPDNRVTGIAALDADRVYVGVGSNNSGGIVELHDGRIRVFDSEGAPKTAGHSLAVFEERVYVAAKKVFILDPTNNQWSSLNRQTAQSLYAGKDRIWASRYGRELFSLLDDDKANEFYRSIWLPRGSGKAGYLVRFLMERDDAIWFGGSPTRRFISSGFYQFDKSTGLVTIYGPRHGFPLSGIYECYGGVWADGHFWLSTSGGFLKVTPRPNE